MIIRAEHNCVSIVVFPYDSLSVCRASKLFSDRLDVAQGTSTRHGKQAPAVRMTAQRGGVQIQLTSGPADADRIAACRTPEEAECVFYARLLVLMSAHPQLLDLLMGLSEGVGYIEGWDARSQQIADALGYFQDKEVSIPQATVERFKASRLGALASIEKSANIAGAEPGKDAK